MWYPTHNELLAAGIVTRIVDANQLAISGVGTAWKNPSGVRAVLDAVVLKSPLGAFLLAILGLVLSIYATWFNDKKTELSVAEMANSAVLSEHAAIPTLEIRFRGEAVDQKATPLRVLLIGVWNSGETTVRQSDFDINAPVGFRVEGGTPLFAAVEQASSDYLRMASEPTLGSDSIVRLKPAIFEPKDSVTIKVLVLQNPNATVTVKPVGKVAGSPEVVERTVIWHPAGYIQGYQTAGEMTFRKYFAGFIIGASSLNFLFALIAKYRARRQKPSSASREDKNQSDG